MPRAENRISINRPIDDVFNFLADGENNQYWRDGVIQIARTSPGEGQGATYRQILSGPGGRKIDGDYQITAYSPPRLLAFEVTAGPARPTGQFSLSERGSDQTDIIFVLELNPSGIMRLMSRMIAKQMEREVGALGKLKSVLEDRPSPGSAAGPV